MYWYVLFVKTGRERIVEKFLKNLLDTDVSMPFIPLKENIFKTAGKVKKELKNLFPGYIFIDSELPDLEFIKMIVKIINSLNESIRILRYSDTEFAMRESERQLLLSFCNDDHCIESSSGFMEGDRIHITDGPLRGWESTIKKINRHKRQAWIAIQFMGEIRLVNVALEVIEKI